MSDERIVEYLRRRAQVEPPLDFVASVADAVAAVPQRRVSWFAPLLPAAAAVGAIAVVTALAVLLSREPSIGPSPEPTQPQRSQQASTEEPSSTVEPSGSAAPGSAGSLLEPGDTAPIPATWADGPFGTITLQRGPDTGGYRLVSEPSSDDHFFIEVEVAYELDRVPEGADWGGMDWRIVSENGSVEATELGVFPAPETCPGMGQWPGATEPEPRYEGCLAFAIPRSAAQTELLLVYQPTWASEPLAHFPVRAPGDAPAPVAADWPRPDPVYVAKPGLPITVLESVEADALFEDSDTCTNPEGGYTVTFPESWYTNTAIGDVPACTWFSPTFYKATEGGPRPDEIAIEIQVFEGAIGFLWVDLYTEDVVLDGVPARRYETGMTKDINTPTDQFQYSYLAYLDEDDEGRKLWAFTGTEYGGDYELNKAVFDRIMASLEFTD